MKACLRCQSMMVEGCALTVESARFPVAVAQEDFRGKKVGRLVCAVCPQCGYVELQLADISNEQVQKKLK